MITNLKRSAYEQIRAELFAGHMAPGATLSAVALAKQFGMSHTPVREAISQLETEGFVEQVPRLGHQVKAFDYRELNDLFEIRQSLEQCAAAQAAERISQAEIERLWGLCDQYRVMARAWRDTTDPNEARELVGRLARLDAAFHLQLLHAAGNRRLIKLVGDLQLMTMLFRRNADIPRPLALRRWARSYREHCLIARAVQRRDVAGAAAAAAAHLQGARKFYLEAFEYIRRTTSPLADPDLAWSAELLSSIDDAGCESVPPVRHRRK